MVVAGAGAGVVVVGTGAGVVVVVVVVVVGTRARVVDAVETAKILLLSSVATPVLDPVVLNWSWLADNLLVFLVLDGAAVLAAPHDA